MVLITVRSSILLLIWQGFEPRGTDLSNRIVTTRNLYEAEEDGTISYLPSRVTQNRRRRSQVTTSCGQQSSLNLCEDPDWASKRVESVLAFESESGEDLFNAKSLKAVCKLADEVIKPVACSAPYCHMCCDSWSIGNYIALLHKRPTCADITDGDVSATLELLGNCSSYFIAEDLKGSCTYTAGQGNRSAVNSCPKVPPHCIEHTAVYNILRYLTDNEFMSEPEKTFLKYAAVLPAVFQWDPSFFEEVYRTQLANGLPSADGVKLVGFRLGALKYDQFSKQLLIDGVFIGIALMFVLVIMWLFLRSFVLAFAAILCIIFALVLSYFFYKIVFRITFFPFLNVLAAVFLVGIGADDAFVYYDIWLQKRNEFPDANVGQLTVQTLRYAALSMLVTSLTTSAAFFAGLSSSISSIKCFGIFAGMSILTNYLLMITWYPACVALHERWVLKRVVDQRPKSTVHESEESAEVERYLPSKSKFIDNPCGLIPSLIPFFQKTSKKVFEKWLPAAILKLYWLWLFLFVGLTAGFLCVNFVSPRLDLPSSGDFQVFSSSHPLEQYSLRYKQHFRFESQGEGTGIIIALMWGLKKADNGDHLDPDDLGTLEFDTSFADVFSKESQMWLLSLCETIRKQEFYSAQRGDSCIIEAVKQVCGSCDCGSKSPPYDPQALEACLLPHAGLVKFLLFEKDSRKPFGMRLLFNTNRFFTQSFDPMDKFWKDVNAWADERFAEAPAGLKNGWVCTYWYQMLEFYNLQRGLSEGTYSSLGISVAIAFGIMLLTTLNIFISIYAILTIVGIIAITIGALVLDGWQLNVLESIVLSVSVGLSIDFTMHYGVAYRLCPDKSSRQVRVRYALSHIGSAISMAAVTTFLTGKPDMINNDDNNDSDNKDNHNTNDSENDYDNCG